MVKSAEEVRLLPERFKVPAISDVPAPLISKTPAIVRLPPEETVFEEEKN